MAIKIPEYQSQVQLPSGASREGSVVLPDLGLTAIGKEIAQSGEVLAQVATRGMAMERQNQQAMLAAEAHKLAWEEVQKTRNEDPWVAAKELPDRLNALFTQLTEGHDEAMSKVFLPQFQRITQSYLQTATAHLQHRQDAHIRAQGIRTLDNFERQLATVSEDDPASTGIRAGIVADALAWVDAQSRSAAWAPEDLARIRGKLLDRNQDIEFWQKVRELGPAKVQDILERDPAQVNVSVEKAPQMLAALSSYREHRSQKVVNELLTLHPNGIPLDELDRHKSEILPRHEQAERRRTTTNEWLNRADMGDPVQVYKQAIVDGELLRKVPDPELRGHIASQLHERRNRPIEENGRVLLYNFLNNKLTPADMQKVIEQADYYPMTMVKTIMAAMQAENVRVSNPKVYWAAYRNLTGSNESASGRPIITYDYLNYQGQAGELTKEDHRYFIGMLRNREAGDKKPIEREIRKFSDEIYKMFKGVIGLPEASDFQPTNPEHSRVLRHAQTYIKDWDNGIRHYLQNNPNASRADVEAEGLAMLERVKVKKMELYQSLGAEKRWQESWNPWKHVTGPPKVKEPVPVQKFRRPTSTFTVPPPGTPVEMP